MLDKMKIIMVVGIALQVIRNFFPQLEIPEDFQPAVETIINSLYVVVPVIIGWLTRESQAQINKLVTRR